MQHIGLLRRLRQMGAAGALHAISRRIVPRPLPIYRTTAARFEGRCGLEIGGPSAVFARRGLFPVYALARRIDNCTFGPCTLWQSGGTPGAFDAARERGSQFFLEATDLAAIQSEIYEFVLSSHALEHIANPLRALSEWLRVLKDDGTFVLVVPHKEGTFDHHRPVTALEHLMDDLRHDTPESDMTHLAEILSLHDLRRDPAAGDIEAFRRRAERNLEFRGLHHHVFDTDLAVRMLEHMKLEILAVEPARPYHIFVVARKCSAVLAGKCATVVAGKFPPVAADSSRGAPGTAAYRRSSPFRSDRS